MGAESICIVDFGGSCWFIGEPVVNYWADYFPSDKVVRFGGLWRTVPDMPALIEPTEAQVYEWVNKYPSPLELRIAAKKKRDAERGRRSKQLQRLFDKKGPNKVVAHLINSAGENISINGAVGIRSKLEVLRSIGYHLQNKESMYFGCKLHKLDFIENITKQDTLTLQFNIL